MAAAVSTERCNGAGAHPMTAAMHAPWRRKRSVVSRFLGDEVRRGQSARFTAASNPNPNPNPSLHPRHQPPNAFGILLRWSDRSRRPWPVRRVSQGTRPLKSTGVRTYRPPSQPVTGRPQIHEFCRDEGHLLQCRWPCNSLGLKGHPCDFQTSNIHKFYSSTTKIKSTLFEFLIN